MLIGVSIFYVADPLHCRGVLFVLTAIALHAMSVSLCPHHDPMLASSNLVFEAAPVCSPQVIGLISKICATVCWALLIIFEGPYVVWESLERAVLLENGAITAVSHIAALNVV